jgi:hypothetical protein
MRMRRLLRAFPSNDLQHQISAISLFHLQPYKPSTMRARSADICQPAASFLLPKSAGISLIYSLTLVQEPKFRIRTVVF